MTSSALRSSPITEPSSLLRPLLTSPGLSPRRSPQVRCRIVPLTPPGSTACVSDDCWTSLFWASSSDARGLTAGSCSYGQGFATRFFPPSPRGSALRFATVGVISSGWLLSANSILPMLGTPSPERKLAGKTSRQEYSLAPARPWSGRPFAGATPPRPRPEGADSRRLPVPRMASFRKTRARLTTVFETHPREPGARIPSKEPEDAARVFRVGPAERFHMAGSFYLPEWQGNRGCVS